MKASTVNENIIAKLEGFDFSETARYAFVHTMSVEYSRLTIFLEARISDLTNLQWWNQWVH